jgi:hypothetical protein
LGDGRRSAAEIWGICRVLIERDRSPLLLADTRQRLLPATAEPAGIQANCALLLEGAACAKTAVARTGDSEILARIQVAGRDQVVTCGIETPPPRSSARRAG